MHDTNFVIKVGDLLRNPGRVEELSFDHLMIDALVDLSSDGVSLTSQIQGVSDGSVKIIIDKLSCVMTDISDLSGESYQRSVLVEDHTVLFSSLVGTDVFDHDKVYDDIFPLDNAHDVVNLYEPLLQLIQLQKPLVCYKPGEEKLRDNFESGDESDLL